MAIDAMQRLNPAAERLKEHARKVINLTSRATISLCFDDNHIRIPNMTVFKSRIVNLPRNAEQRFTFEAAGASSLRRSRNICSPLQHPRATWRRWKASIRP